MEDLNLDNWILGNISRGVNQLTYKLLATSNYKLTLLTNFTHICTQEKKEKKRKKKKEKKKGFKNL